MDRPTLRLSVYPQGNRSAMMAIAISKESSLSALVSEAARTLGSKETHMCLETGARIADISLIRDGDILMLASPPVEFKAGFGNMDEKLHCYRNPSLTQTSHQSFASRAVSAQGWSGGPSITETRPQTCHMMEEEQISHRHPLSSHSFVSTTGSSQGQRGGHPSLNSSRAGISHQNRHIMGFQGRAQGYQNHFTALPSPLSHDGRTTGYTHTPDVSRGNQAPTMSQHMPSGARQSWMQHQPSPMHVVEPAHAGGSTHIPRVSAPLGNVSSYTGVNGQLPIVNERREIPGIYPNHNNVLHHADSHASNSTNLRYEQQASTFQEASTTYTQTGGIYVHGKSRVPIGGTHVPNTAQRVNGAPQGAAADHSGAKRVTSSRGKKERNPPKRRRFPKSICHWCGSICKEGLARHIQEKCNDGLFRAACDVIRKMLGNGKMRVSKGDIKKAYVELMKRPEFKSELITRIREQMTDRVKATIRHTVRAPPSNVLGYKAFHGLDAMVCLFFRLFGLKMPVAAGLDSYNFTGFDADISAEVKKFILRWILMTRKTAGRDGLNAIGYTSLDSLSNGDCKVVLDMSPEDW